MRKITALVFVLSSLLLASCTSNGMIPGKSGLQMKSIYQEYMNLGDAYMELKKYDKAVTYYELASERKELYWTACYKLAQVYLKQGNFSSSLANYQKLIKRDPDNSQLKESIAYIYGQTGDFSSAIQVYEELVTLYPESQAYLENYIVVLISAEENEKASEKIDLLLELFPDNTKASKFKEKITPAEKKEASEESSNALSEIPVETAVTSD